MKKNIIIALAACVALVACTKNELKPVEVDQQITFQAVVNKASTKALIDGTTSYPTGETFGTVAYKVNNSVSELYIPVSEVKYYDTSSPAYWSTAAAYYWPKEKGSSLTFYSYSPFNYSEDGTTPISVRAAETGLTFTNYSVKEHQQTDLMVADKKDNQTSNTPTTNSWAAGVPTVFHHMLAQIVAINFQTVVDATDDPVVVWDYANHHDGTSEKKYVAGDKQFVVTGVYFEKFYEQGTLTAGAAQSWESTGSVTDSYTWYSSEQSGPANFTEGQCTPRNNYYLVLPQNFNDENAKLHVTYEIHTYTSANAHATEYMEATVALKDLNASWEKNKKYTYTLNIDLDRIYWDPKVTEWESGSTGSAEI